MSDPYTSHAIAPLSAYSCVCVCVFVCVCVRTGGSRPPGRLRPVVEGSEGPPQGPDFVLCIGDDRSDEEMFTSIEALKATPRMMTSEVSKCMSTQRFMLKGLFPAHNADNQPFTCTQQTWRALPRCAHLCCNYDMICLHIPCLHMPPIHACIHPAYTLPTHAAELFCSVTLPFVCVCVCMCVCTGVCCDSGSEAQSCALLPQRP